MLYHIYIYIYISGVPMPIGQTMTFVIYAPTRLTKYIYICPRISVVAADASWRRARLFNFLRTLKTGMQGLMGQHPLQIINGSN